MKVGVEETQEHLHLLEYSNDTLRKPWINFFSDDFLSDDSKFFDIGM